MAHEESVAQRRWREFEKLAVEMVEASFQIRPDVIHVTRPSKDGGVDGYIELVVANGLAGRIEHRTLIEAKLRTPGGGVDLGTIASTMVIAYNEAAQSLFLVTNVNFTPQALSQISVFLAKTNLSVHLVDGATLRGWVKRNARHLKGNYSEDLLELLSVGDEKPEIEQDTLYSETTLTQDLHGRAQLFALPRVKVSTGWLESGEIADCRAKLEWTKETSQKRSLPTLVGQKREATVDKLITAINGQSCVAILAGLPGVGKSIVLDHLVMRSAEEPEDLFSFGFVDVGRALTSRGLFLDILAACSGIDYRIIYGDSQEAIDPEHLVARVAGRETPDVVKAAVADILRESVEGFQSVRDISSGPLLEFLEEVAAPHARQKRITIIFQELNRAPSECLEFLVKAVKRLESAGLRVIVELRDRGNLPGFAERSSESGFTLMPLEEWEAFVQTFLRLQTCGVFRVDPLDENEAHEYLEQLLPGLGPERAQVVYKRVGGIPLHLKSAAVWLETEHVVDHYGGALPIVEELEIFFEGIRPERIVGLFDQLVEAWWGRRGVPLRDFIAAAALLDGRLKLEVLDHLRRDQELDEVVEQLLDSTLFSWSKQVHSELEVSHDLLRERITDFASRHRLAKMRVAEKIIPHVHEIWKDSTVRELRTVDLLSALGHWEEVQERSHAVGSKLAEAHEWTNASRYLSLAHDALRKRAQTDSPWQTNDSQSEVEILIALLDVEAKRRRISLDSNETRLNALSLLLTHMQRTGDTAGWPVFWLQKVLLQWSHHFFREEFTSAADLAQEAKEFVLRHESEIPAELAGKAWNALGLTYKVTNRRAKSLKIFDEAASKFPDLKSIQNARRSNLAAFALRKDPSEALRLYNEILEIDGSADNLHTRVDLAMALFLMGEYDEARKSGEIALRLATDSGVPAQEARARNILACCLWTSDEVAKADHQFDLASVAAERTMFRRFLWRIRVNRSGTAVESDQPSISYSLARSAEEDILLPREPTFAEIRKFKGYLTARWYVALLAIGKRYRLLQRNHDYERLCERVQLPKFLAHLEAWVSGDLAPEVFSGTSHIHQGRIMITG